MTRIWWIESRRSTAARLGPALLAMNVLMLLTLPAAAGRTGRTSVSSAGSNQVLTKCLQRTRTRVV